MLTSNRIELQGVAQTDPQDMKTQNGKEYSTFILDVPGKKSDGTDYHSYFEISAWDEKLRQAMSQGVYKGAEVRVEGMLGSNKNQARNGNVYFNYSIRPFRIQVSEPKQNQYNQAAQQAARQVSADDLSGGQGQPASWINDPRLPF